MFDERFSHLSKGLSPVLDDYEIKYLETSKMKSEFNVANLRYTIFTPKVSYSQENLVKLMALFPGYLPTLLQRPIPIQVLGNLSVQLENEPWQLMSIDKRECICFYDEKIDIIISCDQTMYSSKEHNSFNVHALDMMSKIIDGFNFDVYRIAYAPTLLFSDEEKSFVSSFSERVFKINSFQNTSLSNLDFTQVYRLEKRLDDKMFLINHLIRFMSSEHLVRKNNEFSKSDSLTISVDINTYVNPEYKFGRIEVEKFLSESPSWCNDLLNLYFQTNAESKC